MTDDVDDVDGDPVARALERTDRVPTVDVNASASPPSEGPINPSPDADAGDDSQGSANPELEPREASPLKRWLQRVPDGSHVDFRNRELWDPDNGGERRILFHLADAADGDGGIGYPNGVGILVGLAEIYYRRAFGDGDRDGAGGADRADDVDGDRDGAGDAAREELSRQEAEQYV